MRETGGGRSAVPSWSDAPTARPYAVGERVYSGDCAGTVHAVGSTTFDVAWDDGAYGPITYPMDAGYLRRAMPWET